ncbi:MAG: hypothetical protein WBV11_13555 [Salegentibacter sp.]
MRIITIIAVLFVFGCTPKIHKNFQNNRYVLDYSVHIINDPLQLYFKTPADIEYVSDRRQLKQIIRNTRMNLDNKVLVYGKSQLPPYYEFFVTVGNYSEENNHNGIEYDTVVSGKEISFIGNPIGNSSTSLRKDLEDAFKSLEIGSDYRKEISTVMDVVSRYRHSNKFLHGLDQVQQFPAYDASEKWAKFQMEITFASFLGENEIYKDLLDQFEAGYKPQDSIRAIIREHAIFDSEAIDEIITQAKKHKILMINENHFYPNQRLLIIELLPRLKAIGYSKLALEALGKDQDSVLNKNNAYPDMETGFYTHEQNFSNLIRKAKALGFEFVAYENRAGKDREAGQAENLYNKTFGKELNSKVVVLAGIDHILEKTTKSGTVRMAKVFKDHYNIDPLTISQTHLSYYARYFGKKYVLTKSDHFKSKKLNSVDYHLLNNNAIDFSQWDSSYNYKNENDTKVQVALFYGSEIKNKTDYHHKIPYFTILVEKGDKLKVPINTQEKTFLYTFDAQGNRLDKIVISASNEELSETQEAEHVWR